MGDKTGRFSVLFGLMSLFIVIPMANAELQWESEIVSKGVPGQAEGAKIGKYYFAPSGSRFELGNSITIMDFQTGGMYVLDTQEKTYREMIPREITEEMDPENREFMKKMVERMMGSVDVTPTDVTKEIAGYKCQKYDLTMMGLKSEYWLSKDVEGYKEFRAISENMAKAFERNPMLKGTNVMGMMDQLDGFPVMTVQRTPGGGTVTTTVRHIEQRPLSKDLFVIPAGYTLEKEEMGEPIVPSQPPDEMPEQIPEEIRKMMEQMEKRAGGTGE
jgi:hypothetical protein